MLTIVFGRLLSPKTKGMVERIILITAILSFIIHLSLIYLYKAGLINVGHDTELFKSPIAAIYTPFSFILIYEVYLLVFYIPKSITTYVSKQYEIIALIVIRRLFKDLSHLEFSPNWLYIKGDRQFSYDIVLSILIFFIIYLFKKNIYRRATAEDKELSITKPYDAFINFKKIIAVSLVPILIFIAFYSLINWLFSLTATDALPNASFANINNIFFEDFFTILIVVDVLLLLISFFYTDSFHKVIRNSGFIISTILIRLSFSTEGLLNNILILSSLLFGLFILIIHNKFEQLTTDEQL